MSEISTKVKAILQNELDCSLLELDHVDPHHKLKEDLGADSLNMVCIAIEIEKEFGIVINDSEMELIETVGELIEMVEKSIVNK